MLPFPAAYLAVALTAFATVLAFQHTIRLADQGVGIGSWIPQLIYVAGVAIALVGAILGAMASVRRPTAAAPDPGGTAAGSPEADQAGAAFATARSFIGRPEPP